MNMNVLRQEGKTPILIPIAGIIVLVGALHLARDVLIPVAVAVLLSFLLNPLVRRFTRWGFPNVIAVLTTVGMAFTLLAVIGWLVSAQFVNLVKELPNYQYNLQVKIAEIQEPRDTVFSRAWEMFGSLRRDIEEKEQARAAAEGSEKTEPIAVQVEEKAPTPAELLARYAGALLGPAGLAGVSCIFIIFMLLQRNDLRDRFVKLVSGGNLNLATQAVDDAAQRVTRYLLMQMIINVTYGIPFGLGLYFIGVPNALLWGILAMLLRFIPFVGPWIAAAFPITLAVAVDTGWTMPLMVIGLVVILELISNNVIEPWLYGSSTGISIVALLFAALLWTWVWGPIGLVLSTPMTVCLLVLGKNVPALNFLHVILGSEPALEQEERMYQRMLAMDPEGMLDQSTEYLESNSLADLYDRVMVPALTMSERDRYSGGLAEQRQQFMMQATRDLIEELGTRYPVPPPMSAHPRVICSPAKDEADELSAAMLAQLLTHAGVPAEVGPIREPAAKATGEVGDSAEPVVCICAVPPGALAAVRTKCRRLRQARPELKLVAGVWGQSKSASELRERLTSFSPDLVATSFAEALSQVTQLVIPESAEAIEEARTGQT